MSRFLERVNRTPVSAELLGEVLEMHAALPMEERSVLEVRTRRLFELLERKDLGKNRGALAVAIDFRLTALARLQGEDVLRGWSLPGGQTGTDYIHVDLLKAAAEEPLIGDASGQASFDVESLRRRVLTHAKTRGQA